jgi:hypothetical protein
MKCLTLYQPWATLLILGAKKIETRSWQTSHRGPLAIHAGAKDHPTLRPLCHEPPFREVLASHGITDWDQLPRKVLLGTVTLVDEELPVEETLQRLRAHAPPGLDILSARRVGRKDSLQVKALSYRSPEHRFRDLLQRLLRRSPEQRLRDLQASLQGKGDEASPVWWRRSTEAYTAWLMARGVRRTRPSGVLSQAVYAGDERARDERMFSFQGFLAPHPNRIVGRRHRAE